MKIAIFGATGGTGSQVMERALAAHDVTAVARRPEAITTTNARLRVVTGDVLDPASIAAAIAGADAVISAFGPANNKQPGTLISDGIKNIVAACEHAGTKRFVFESGLMVGDGRGLSAFGRFATSIFRSLNKKLYLDKKAAEATIMASSLAWVIVRPGALDHSPARGDYKFGVDARLNPAKKLSHTDAADFLLRAAIEPDFVRTIQDVGR